VALVEDSSALWGFLVAVGIVLVLTPLVSALAPRIGGVDDKTDRPRVHTNPVPRIGGLAIVGGILVPMAIFMHLNGAYLGILISCFAIAVPLMLAGALLAAPRCPALSLLALASVGTVIAGLLAVYWIGSRPVAWYVLTSVDRVLASAVVMSVVFLALLLGEASRQNPAAVP